MKHHFLGHWNGSAKIENRLSPQGRTSSQLLPAHTNSQGTFCSLQLLHFRCSIQLENVLSSRCWQLWECRRRKGRKLKAEPIRVSATNTPERSPSRLSQSLTVAAANDLDFHILLGQLRGNRARAKTVKALLGPKITEQSGDVGLQDGNWWAVQQAAWGGWLQHQQRGFL